MAFILVQKLRIISLRGTLPLVTNDSLMPHQCGGVPLIDQWLHQFPVIRVKALWHIFDGPWSDCIQF